MELRFRFCGFLGLAKNRRAAKCRGSLAQISATLLAHRFRTCFGLPRRSLERFCGYVKRL
eukprot:208931-Karenia_brevis.AAC.1